MNISNLLHYSNYKSIPSNSVRFRPNFRIVLSILVVIIVLLPLLLLTLALFDINAERWLGMWETFLPRALSNTVILAVGVGVGTFLLGTSLAALIAAYDFPGRRLFDRVLLLPLAIPGFIMGFVYVTIFEFAGPVQTTLRSWFGWGRDDYWFPNIASPGGLILVMTLVLYPYVYILARAAFREQVASTFDAARVMGRSRMMAFIRLSLPLAYPQIAAGVLLTVLETFTDYGTVSYFGFPTLSERVIVLWNTEYRPETATQLALMMMVVALLLIAIERRMRRKAKFYQATGSKKIKPRKLTGIPKYSASLFCAFILIIAFIMPVYQLLIWAVGEMQSPTVNILQEAFVQYAGNSISLAVITAVITIIVSLLIVYGLRKTSTTNFRLTRLVSRFVTLGYAIPGAVIAVGVLTLINPIDSAVTDVATTHLGWGASGYLLTGTIFALVYGYTVRFVSLGFNSADASLEKIGNNLEDAARMAGAGEWRVLRRIHAPLMKTGLAAGAILIFVDVIKELPATLLLRPFGMDTLAIRTYFLSIEGWHRSAAIPALAILIVGLIPVIMLMRVGEQPVDSR